MASIRLLKENDNLSFSLRGRGLFSTVYWTETTPRMYALCTQMDKLLVILEVSRYC